MRNRIIAIGATAVVAVGLALAFLLPAAATTHGGYPTPTATATVTPTVTPTAMPTQPTPTPTVPVVNPFAGCRFTTTFAQTFDRLRGRFIFRAIPAIVCNFGFGRVEVFDLVRLGK